MMSRKGSSHVKLRLPLEHNSGDSCCFCGQCAAGQKSREGRGWAQRCAPGAFPCEAVFAGRREPELLPALAATPAGLLGPSSELV